MTTSKVRIPTYEKKNHLQQDNDLSRCKLKWRQGQLLVSPEQQCQPHLPSLESQQWLVECLQHSPVRLIRIALSLDQASLKFWVDACEQASKLVFLQIPTAQELPSKRCPRSWWLKRLIDWSAATLLLLVLSPILLGIVCLMRVQSPEPIFCSSWCVGERGKLFRLFKFRTIVVNAQTLHNFDEPRITPLERWMRKYGVNQLPQLFNVLRGEMSLVGPRPLTVYDAVRISPERRVELNALPGIIRALQVNASSKLLDIDAVNRCNWEYLRNWSLWRDLKILLMTIAEGSFRLWRLLVHNYCL